ncbi:heptaprenyl diphosphate synthase component I [Oxobacter pfennigii]|uniref:Heptaprenyl diphosphate synthase component I n=1 Tax=Oxobacter pfennigii TaxID=36849 RepID=A0A0P9AFC0_9CLOT|nr:Gx transporter family protein [Oxobacter pfennigii]KPU44055.1 heptaprenyl diphosphate synthase component I [Oxobacter pfennigii]
MKKLRKLTTLAMFISVALVLHVVEGMLPVPFTVPGIKLGLANIVTVIALMFFNFREILLIVIIRCLLGSLFGGSISAFLFSVTGGLLSAAVMAIIFYLFKDSFSVIGISIVGAISHNIGQLFIASLIISDFRLYVYLPVLMISSLVTGVFIGIIVNFAKGLLIKNISKLGLDFNDN